jgi:uncharacterized protein DUF177 involved in 23S rRNA accumulation
MTEIAPFTRAMRVESIPEGGLERVIEADEVERLALAKLNGLAALGRLQAKFMLRRAGRGIVRVQGAVHAEATQTCVVSLEPLDVVIDETVDVRFATPAGEKPAKRPPPTAAAVEETAFSLNDEDEPDPIRDGQIDLGALAAEFMVLALDPYPRKPGVDFSPPPSDEEPAAGIGALLSGRSNKP